MSFAYNSTQKKEKGAAACLLTLLRKSWTKCWISEFVKMVLSFLRNRRARLGSYFSRTQSSKSVRHRSTVASSAFCVIVFINLLKLIYTDWSFVEPRFAGARFYIVYCQVKRCIVGFHFRGSLFSAQTL